MRLGLVAVVCAALLAVAALYTDARCREIPHWLTGGLLSVWLLAVGLVPEAMGTSARAALSCGAAALAAGYVFYRFGWWGGGDGKLLAALALWIGPWDAGVWLLGTAALGLAMWLLALALPRGDFRTRGIPFAWAMVPPAAALLTARAATLA